MKKIKFNITKELKPVGKGKKCFLCNLAKDTKSAKDYLIYEDRKFISLLDPYSPTKGYVVLGTKKHIEDIIELNSKEYLELQKLVRKISIALKKAFKPKRIVLAQTGGLVSISISRLYLFTSQYIRNF